MISSISISSATLRRSPALSARRLLMEVNPVSSSNDGARVHQLMRRQIRARSTWPRPAMGRRNHVAGENCSRCMAGIDMVHVPLSRPAPAVTNLLGGQVQVMFDTSRLPRLSTSGLAMLRPLAVTTATRAEVLPDTPPMSRFLPGYEASGWYRRSGRKETRLSRSC